MPAQTGMGSSTKTVPRPSPKVPATVALPKIDFRDVAAQFGVTAPNFYGGERTKRHILEMTGNGVALVDYNQDGKLDILLVNGARLDGTSRPSVLYKNTGAGKFVDATVEAGLVTSGWAQGVCAGDYDNDGFTDLLITRYGGNLLFHNENGRFRSLDFPRTPDAFHTGCTFFDYDRDGKLDLFVASYVAFPLAQAQRGAATCSWLGVSVFCGPRGFPTGVNHLFHNDGQGRFRDVSVSAGIRVEGLHYGLGVTSADFDDDGWPDLYVACDSTPSLLYRNQHDGTFAEVAVPAGVAYGGNGEEQGGMGVAVADVDQDGKLDILRSNFIDETATTLYRNLGELFFSDVTVAAGFGINTRFVSWGAQFIDVDQDGRQDLIVANGHIYPELARAQTTDPLVMPRLLYWNLGGAFVDASARSGAGVLAAHSSRGLATGDLDGDGSPEIVIVNMNAPPTILKNYGDRGNWLRVRLVGVESNRSAIGAVVRVTAGGVTQTSVVASGSSYLSQSDFRQSFGLGKLTIVERVEILWPRGRREARENVPVNQEIEVREGSLR